MTVETIVVGVDDTASSVAAVHWAAAEAASRGAHLCLVSAVTDARTSLAPSFYAAIPVPDLAELRKYGRDTLTRLSGVAREHLATDSISTRLSDDDAASALIAASKTAALVVVGSRGRGAAGSVFLGSVGSKVAVRASCPVVVVRGPAGEAGENPAVVVGVDVDGSSDAVAFAFDFAARRGLPVKAIMCWHPDRLAEMMWRPAQPAPHWLTVLLDKHLAPYRDKYPDVVVHAGVERQHAGDALVDASAGQALLVVGERSRHQNLGTMLGSVSQGVLHHATCPVAVVR